MVTLPYETYYDEMPCYVSVQDKNLKLISANRRFREQFGAIEGRYCYQVYKNRPEKCELCPVERTFDDGISHRSEERVTCLNGREVSVIVYTTPIRNEAGEIEAVMEMSTDITAIKRLETQLKDSRTRYRQLFDEVPCFVSIQDRDLNVIDANRLHRETFGERYGGKCYEYYKHRDEPCTPCMVHNTFDDGQIHVHEEVVTTRDDRTLNVLVHTSPLHNADGEIDSVIEISTDITPIRQLQTQLTNIGLLISSISHGVKGLLNGLDGGVYLVNSGMKKGNQARVEQGWEIVLRNVSRIRSMVLDILYYAKDREVEWEDLNLSEFAETVHGVLQSRAEELGVELIFEVAEDIGHMQADHKAIRATLVNLLENSLDACRVDKKKDEHTVKMAFSGDAHSVQFKISDNGIGMARETREKAFSLFFSSKGNEGTGLGLFIADKIVTSHGGQILLESEPGQGSCFTLDLPREPSEKKPDSVTQTAGQPNSELVNGG
ncbi:MAG TPA: PAS domain-containing protein [Bacteroidetes bacterium]|nr:sporulation kinase E [bacterium BMS3Bbin04]HDO64418.1 PAS domain-containing protein [Bacteroidota bacterium]HEX03543.1 PAS domain-containing protein [Bacteroidota bacterium]